MSGRTLRIGLLAIAGLLVAAALGAAASRITSNQVGLYGEPPSVGSELVVEPAGIRAKPQRRPDERSGHARRRPAEDTDDSVAPPTPAETTTAPAPAGESTAESGEETTSEAEPEPVETEDGDSDDD